VLYFLPIRVLLWFTHIVGQSSTHLSFFPPPYLSRKDANESFPPGLFAVSLICTSPPLARVSCWNRPIDACHAPISLFFHSQRRSLLASWPKVSSVDLVFSSFPCTRCPFLPVWCFTSLGRVLFSSGQATLSNCIPRAARLPGLLG